MIQLSKQPITKRRSAESLKTGKFHGKSARKQHGQDVPTTYFEKVADRIMAEIRLPLLNMAYPGHICRVNCIQSETASATSKLGLRLTQEALRVFNDVVKNVLILYLYV